MKKNDIKSKRFCSMTVAEIYSFFFLNICLAFYGFIDRTAEDMTGNRERERERGNDMQQRDPG